ncbi:hypothetical protein DL95DRAFT_52753 [Leptodontidium sp. 2 PMI_412]|nr:hypothetical protein DL95DRAFT_52753 [Leptodontidium sp. 2 PMI_412]
MADHDRRKIRKLTHAFADGTATHPTPLGILQRHAEQMSCMPPQYVFWRLENKSKGTGIDWIAAVLIRGRYIWTSDRHKFKIHAKMQAAERALVWHYSSSLEPFADTISSRNAIISPRYMNRQGGFAVEFDWSVPVLKNVVSSIRKNEFCILQIDSKLTTYSRPVESGRSGEMHRRYSRNFS